MQNSARERVPEEPTDATETDASVVLRVRAGDADAFRILVLRHQDGLFRYALRMVRSRDTAADLVQASFVKAYTNLERCDPDRFPAWLFRILVNRCKDHLKNRRRLDVRLDDAPGVGRSSEDPERELERSELRGTLERALDRLPEAQRQAFLLKHLEGLSYEEMAARLGGSVPALKMRVHCARDALQAMLEEGT